MSRKLAKRTKRRTAHKRNRWRDELEMANGCLDMVREELVALGMNMDGCPAMFYNDAIRNVAVILGLRAGLAEYEDVKRVLQEHAVNRGAREGSRTE